MPVSFGELRAGYGVIVLVMVIVVAVMAVRFGHTLFPEADDRELTAIEPKRASGTGLIPVQRRIPPQPTDMGEVPVVA